MRSRRARGVARIAPRSPRADTSSTRWRRRCGGVERAGDSQEAVLLAADLAGDADTVAAVTGQIAGALWSRGGIPAHWLDRLAWREEIEWKGRRLIAAAGTHG